MNDKVRVTNPYIAPNSSIEELQEKSQEDNSPPNFTNLAISSSLTQARREEALNETDKDIDKNTDKEASDKEASDKEASEHSSSQIQDLSERKRTENALRESEALQTAIIQTALDCIITMSHEGKVQEWNPAAEATFGYSRKEAIGTYLHQLIVPPALRDAHIKGLQKYLETGLGPVIGQRLELPAVRKNGASLLVELAIVPIPGVDRPLFAGHLRDITQRKANENALRESEARYTRIAANVPGMVYQFVLRPDGSMSFPFVSEGSRDICEMEPQEIYQRSDLILNLIHPDDKELFSRSISESAAGLTPWKWEGRIVLLNGEEKWIEGASRPKREDNGDILWDGLLLDITQRKRAEADILQARTEAEIARAEAEKANHAKSEFLSRMSHELRTPLNAILGFGQLLEMSDLPDGDQQSINHILKGGRHLLELINEVLDIAKIEAGAFTFSPEPISLPEVCEEVLMMIQPLADKRGITLHNHTAHNPYFVHADRQRFKQILINLLSNAVKYNRDGGSITLDCAQSENNYVRLSVTDTGKGIEPQQRTKLFLPFERLGAENTGIEGTGIGLTLSRRLAEAMNGLLDVHSTPGQGSTFYLELPGAPDPLQNWQEEPHDLAIEQKRLTEKRTVLYIEDNLSNLQLLQRLMERRPNIELLSAMQGRLGLELAQTHLPDLILLDLHLPEMAGLEVLRELQSSESTQGISVIVISADATPGQIQRLLAAGARHYLTKPLVIREFLEVMDNLLKPDKTQ